MKRKSTSEEKMKTALLGISGVKTRRLIVGDSVIYVIFIPHIIDKTSLSANIIKPILDYSGNAPLSLEIIASSVLYSDDILIDSNMDSITNYILDGNAVIIDASDDKYIAVNISKIEKRNISTPELQEGLKSPKDAFNESLESNLSLIRYRIKDPSLVVDNYIIGRRSRTKVAVIYLKDVANPLIIKELEKRLKSINIDGIVQSGHIQKFIQKSIGILFPRIGTIERSEAASASIMGGKILILVDGSNLALSLPQVFVEFLDTGDNHYDNVYISIFNKFLRYIAIAATIVLSSLYVAIVAYHSDVLPAKYILALAVSRATVPVNALLEAFLMEFVAELLREASIRLPRQIGPAIGIVGTIVIGQAAVSAGLVSPLMVIIIALSTMSSFAIPDFTIVNSIRFLKFAMILVTGFLGLFGLTMGLTAVMIGLLSATSFGVPYFSPIAPFNFKDLKKYFLSDIKASKTRPEYAETKDDTRQ